MINENEFDYVDMTGEEARREGVRRCHRTRRNSRSRLSENCLPKIRQAITDRHAENIFSKRGEWWVFQPSDLQAALESEQITLDIQAVKQSAATC